MKNDREKLSHHYKQYEKRTTTLDAALKKGIRSFTRALLKQLKFYTLDENVLFFLLDHYLEFDAFLGKMNTAKSIQAVMDLKDAKHWILTRYEKRGFRHLLPSIQNIFEEWERCV